MLNLAYNNTQDVQFAFTNLDYNETYFVVFYYYSNGELVRINATAARTVHSPYHVCDVNQDGSVTAADITALYDSLLGNSIRFLPYSDVNGDGSITSADITTLYNVILGN